MNSVGSARSDVQTSACVAANVSTSDASPLIKAFRLPFVVVILMLPLVQIIKLACLANGYDKSEAPLFHNCVYLILF